MTDDELVADVLGQVVDLQGGAREKELGEAVARHVSNGPARSAPRMEEPKRITVQVDFTELYLSLGETEAWRVLSKLKEMFG